MWASLVWHLENGVVLNAERKLACLSGKPIELAHLSKKAANFRFRHPLQRRHLLLNEHGSARAKDD